MLKIFFESRFIYYGTENKRNKDYMEDEIAESMANGDISDISAARDIMERLNSLRGDMQRSSLLNDDDQKTWQKKIDEVKEKPTHEEVKKLEQEFKQQQNRIQKTVDQYSTILLANKKAALAEDKEKGVDTYKEYMDWLMKQNDPEKEKALAALDGEIQEKINLRKDILRLNPQLKRDVLKMDRTAMKEKLKELGVCEENFQKARTLLERDKKYSSSIQAHLDKFKDKTPDQQKEWLDTYEEKIAKPRKEVFEKFESIPADVLPNGFKTDFLNSMTAKKNEMLEDLETNIEEKFKVEVRKIPASVWSEKTKEFAINEFLHPDPDKVPKEKVLAEKANRLLKLPEFVKAERKLTDEYTLLRSKYLKDMPEYSLNKWEKLNFEEKEEMIKKMEAETFMKKNFTNLLDNKLKQNVINAKTYSRMMEDYNGTTIEERMRYIRDFSSLMKPREDLLKNFLSLSRETQNHFKESFSGHGYVNRLKILEEAKLFEAKNTDKTKNSKEADKQEYMPQPLNSPELKAIIENLKMQADLCEDEGNLEKALGIHESIIKIDPKNNYSNEKIRDLKSQTEAIDAATKKAPNIFADAALNKEIGNLALLEDLLRDKENQILKANGAEKASKQHAHLGDDSFKHRIHEKINEKSGGKKILGRDGRVKDVYNINVDNFGSDDSEDKIFEIKKQRESLAENENLVESRMTDIHTGKVLNFDEARKKLEIRKQNAAKKFAGRKNIDVMDAEDFIDAGISKAA